MLKNLIIENLQSHKHSELEFGIGLNAIIGPSDMGKSAILRSLDLLFNNHLVDSLHSNWMGPRDRTRVSLEVDDHIIERIKSKSVNEYRLDGHVFKAFGQGVPEEITKILNLSEINFQRQIELPFLLTATSGEVARYLNKIVNLDIIDTASSNIEKKKRKTNSDLSLKEEDLKGKQKELKEKYSDLDNREKDIQELEQIQRESQGLKQSLLRLNNLVSGITRENQTLIPLRHLIGTEGEVNRLIKIGEEVERDRQQLRALHYLTDEIEEGEREIKSLSQIQKAEKEVNRLISLSQEIEELKHQHETLTNLIRLIEEGEEEIENRQEAIAHMVDEFNRAMPDICPLLDEPCSNRQKGKK